MRWVLRRKLLILSACLLALVGAAAAYAALFDHWPGSSKNATPADTEPAERGCGHGSHRAEERHHQSRAGSPPDRLESLLVERGDLVKKGDALGYLAGYAEQIAQRDLIKAQIDEARLRRDTELRLNQARVRAADVHKRRVIEVTRTESPPRSRPLPRLTTRRPIPRIFRPHARCLRSFDNNIWSIKRTPP